MRLADGSFRYWYASRKQPPFLNLYFAINTARWASPSGANETPAVLARLRLPPQIGDTGVLATAESGVGRAVDVLEVIDGQNAIIRAWYMPAGLPAGDDTKPENATFVDLWVQGTDTSGLTLEAPAKFAEVFRVTGNRSFGTDCGGRTLPLLEPVSK
jgi:hypothetical protein